MTTITISNGTTTVSAPIDVTTGYTVEDSGILDVVSGGTISGLIEITSAGTVNIGSGGEALNTTVSSGGALELFSGGVADGTIVSGGLEIVSAVGSDLGAQIVSGEQDVYGTASGVTIFTGSQAVEAGGTASGTIVSGGGLESVSSAAPMSARRFRAASRTSMAVLLAASRSSPARRWSKPPALPAAPSSAEAGSTSASHPAAPARRPAP